MSTYVPPDRLDRDQLIERLNAAEDALLMFAWSPSHAWPDASDTEKAAHELWAEWDRLPGVSCKPGDHPEWTDESIKALADRRDRIRAETLARIEAARELS